MKTIVQSFLMLFVLTVLTGVLYPGFVTIVAQLAWHDKSNGSLISEGGKIIGSSLIAQKFKDDRYFWTRPSASDFSAVPASASNLGPTSQKLKAVVKQRRAELALKHKVSEEQVPAELVTSSASGLDPHLSLMGVQFQIDRVVKARNFTSEQKTHLLALVSQNIERPQWGIFGGARINVFALNRALDAISVN